MRTGLLLGVSGLVPLALVLLPVTLRTAQAPLSVDLSFTLYSEALEPISGARVKLEEDSNNNLLNTGTQVLSSGSDGHTASVPSTVGSVYNVHLKERALPYGTALGQSLYGYTVPAADLDASTSSERLWETILTQPMLRPVIIDSATHRVNNPADQLWSIDFIESDHDVFSFPALIGSLSTADSVSYYLDYCNIDPLEPDYRYGLALRTTAVESLGTHGAVITIDCSSFGFTQAPIVDVCFVAGSAQYLGETTLSFESNWQAGVLRLSASGSIGNGTTLLLVRPDGGGTPNPLYEAVANPPAFGPVTVGFGGVIHAERCIPPEPSPATSDECTPPEPPENDSGGFCPGATPAGPVQVTSDIRRVGAKVCGNGGPPTEVTGTTDWGAQFSAKFNVSGVTITAGGGLKRKESTKTTCTPGSGTGCGECKQVYKIRVFCKQKWIKEVPTFGFFYPFPFEGCEDEEVTTGSVSEIIQETSCPMTGC